METKKMMVAGRVGMVYKGAYSDSKSYSRLDAVSYKNSIYVAKKDSTGILPTNEEYWFLSITGQVGTAENIAYNPAESGLDVDNVQAAIDELVKNGGGNIGGTINYNELENQPSIGGVTLQGDKPLSELGIQPKGDYAETESPEFTGTPKAPTPPAETNNDQIATTAYVKTLLSNLINGAPETLDTLKEIADALGENDDAVQALNVAIAKKADKTEIPTVGNGTLTIQKNGANVQTFLANQSGNVTANITVPTKTSELTNDSGYKTTDTTYSLATQSANGLMSSMDKKKLDGIPDGGSGGAVDILDTPEEIEANAEQGKVAGALAVKEMISELNDKLGLQTRENPSDPTQAQWKNSNGDWVNFKKGGLLLIGAIGTSHDVRQMLPNYQSLTADNFISVITSVSGIQQGGSIITSASLNTKPSYNPTTGTVSAPNGAGEGSVRVSAAGNIYYVE